MTRDRRRRPPYRRCDRLGFWPTMWLMVFGALLGAAMLLLSTPKAHGTPVTYPLDLCSELRAQVPLASIETELRGWGLSDRAAGIYTGTQVRGQCPDLIGYVSGQLA